MTLLNIVIFTVLGLVILLALRQFMRPKKTDAIVPPSLPSPIFGVMGQFEDVTALLRAARKVRQSGYTRTDAFTPYPVHGLDDELGVRKTILPKLVLGAGIMGALTGFGMQYFAMVIHYPLNIGGKPLNSWPAFIPITFEVTILFAALTAVVGMLALNGLPQPYHPVFHIKNFERASVDQYFLCIESDDPKFDADEARKLLSAAGAVEVSDVPR